MILLRRMIQEFINAPYRAGIPGPKIRWEFWNYFDDAVDAGLPSDRAAIHARNETFKDLKKHHMEIGRGKRANRLINKFIDITNEAFDDIERMKSISGIEPKSHWTRKYQTIGL